MGNAVAGTDLLHVVLATHLAFLVCVDPIHYGSACQSALAFTALKIALLGGTQAMVVEPMLGSPAPVPPSRYWEQGYLQCQPDIPLVWPALLLDDANIHQLPVARACRSVATGMAGQGWVILPFLNECACISLLDTLQHFQEPARLRALGRL